MRMLVLRIPSISIGQQAAALDLRQTIVELLVMGQGLGRSENMHNARHVFVDQANQLEIACRRKKDGKFLTLAQNPGRDTACTVKSRRTGGESWTAHIKGRPYLAIGQECEGVWLGGCHGPCDGVTRVNPDLVWQERQALPSEIVTLGPDCCVPLCRQ